MRGLSIGDIAVIVVILITALAFFGILLTSCHGPHDHRGTECMHNVYNITGLLAAAAQNPDAFPDHGGANLILSLVVKGELEGEDYLRTLFCPVDTKESFESAGGLEAYVGLDLSKGGHDHLTSYAGRDLTNQKCSARPGVREKAVVLVCDDSEDHHDGKGFVVGYSDGSVKFRSKVIDWDLDDDSRVVVGPDSVVPELRCLRSD